MEWVIIMIEQDEDDIHELLIEITKDCKEKSIERRKKWICASCEKEKDGRTKEYTDTVLGISECSGCVKAAIMCGECGKYDETHCRGYRILTKLPIGYWISGHGHEWREVCYPCWVLAERPKRQGLVQSVQNEGKGNDPQIDATGLDPRIVDKMANVDDNDMDKPKKPSKAWASRRAHYCGIVEWAYGGHTYRIERNRKGYWMGMVKEDKNDQSGSEAEWRVLTKLSRQRQDVLDEMVPVGGF
jgi:hypothetical protein